MAGVAPNGLGLFLWLPQNCEGGDWDAIIAKAKDHGITWFALHNYFNAGVVQKLKTAGFYVAYSFYTSPNQNIDAQCQAAGTAAHHGCDAILFDAETTWETEPDGKTPKWRGPEATIFMQKLRAAVSDDCYLANAGAWNWPSYHKQYPDREFAAIADAAMPERYWTEFPPGRTYDAIIAESEHEWTTVPDVLGYKAVIPIGAGYGTNGTVPGGHRPLDVNDLKDFITRYPTCSLWSWMHLPKECWDMIKSVKNPDCP